MKRQFFLLGIIVALAFIMTACGTEAIARPDADATNVAGTLIAGGFITPSNTPTETPTNTATNEPTNTPTNTSVPPTATNTPTDVPPTATEAEIATEESVQSENSDLVAENPTEVASGNTPSEEVIAANVAVADVDNGQLLFSANVVPACMTCHYVDQELQFVGPGLYNFRDRAGTRVEGEGPFTYAYNSIRYSQVHVVEGFVAGLMPVYDGVVTDQDVYDIIAYLWTLHD